MKFLVFFPVEKKYMKLWEYYRSDINLIKEISIKTLVTNNFWIFLKNIRNYDYVYSWWWHRIFLITIISKLLKKKIICTGAIHMNDMSGESTYFTKGFIYRFLNRFSLRFCSFNLFLSFDQKKQITKHMKVNNPRVVYSSLDKDHLSKYKILKKKIKLKKFRERKKLITVLWLSMSSIRRKGLLETLDALYLIEKKKYFFYIIGKKGDGFNFLKNYIKKKNMENNVKIIVNASTKEKERYMQSCDMFVQPSWCEGQGFAVVEAMSWGLIPVVSKFTAQPEVVKNNGYIVKQINSLEIKKIIFKFCNTKNKILTKKSLKTLKFCHTFFSYDKHKKNIKVLL